MRSGGGRRMVNVDRILVGRHGGGGRFRTQGAVAKFLALSLCIVEELLEIGLSMTEYSLEYSFSIPIYYYYEELSVKPASLRL